MPFSRGSTVATARVLLVADDSQLQRGLRKSEKDVQGSAGRMSTSLVGVGKAALGLAGVAGIGGAAIAVKKFIDAASNLGEQVNKVSVVFRGSQDQIVAWSKSTADSFGISQRAALESAGVFGNMLVPMGFARDRAREMSQRFVELAADMASFNNASPQEVLEALRSGLAGETEPLRRFGVFLNQDRVQQEALNLGLIHGKEHLTAAGKAAATYSIILKDTKDAQGDFHRTSNSLANQQRILSAEWENAQAQLGKRLLPAAVAVTHELVTLITRVENSKEAQHALNVALEKGTELFQGAEQVARDLVPVLKAVATGVDDIAKALGGWDDAFKLILGGLLLKRLGLLRGAFTGLVGAEAAAGAAGAATGILGAASAAALLRSRLLLLLRGSPYVLALTLAVDDQPLKDVDKWLRGHGILPSQPAGPGLFKTRADYLKWKAQQPGGAGAGGAMDIEKARRSRFGLQLPTSFTSTHETSGLSGFPAVDLFATPGTPVLAPEDGTLYRRHFIDWNIGRRVGGWTVYYHGDETGATYFLTHLGQASAEGRYGRGDVIGTVAAVPGQAWQPHIHEGRSGAPVQVPKGTSTTPVYGTAPAAKAKKKAGAKTAAEPPLIPIAFDIGIAKAALTKRTSDDLLALMGLENYLEKRLAIEKNINKRLELLQELADVRDRLAALREKRKKRAAAARPITGADVDPSGFGSSVAGVISQRPGSVTMLGRGEIGTFAGITEDQAAALGKLLEPMKLEFDQWKGYYLALAAKLKAAKERLASAQRQLKKALSVKAKYRNLRLIAILRRRIELRKQEVADLKEAMDEALGELFRIDADMASATQQAAAEAEASSGTPATADTGGGETGAAGGAGGLSQADVTAATEQNILGFLGAIRGLRNEFGGNVYPLGEFDRYFLPGAEGAGSGVQINNYFSQPPPDAHQFSKQIEFELRHAA